jgi:hypothetical protein
MGRRARARRAKRGRRLRTLAAIVLVCVGLLSACLAAGLLLSGLTGGPAPAPRAAIVDQVSVYDPNPEFVAAATDMLQEAGYVVDYYPGEAVTVDFYRELPTHDYDLIVLRAHSARLLEDKQGRPVDEVILFTSEPFSPTEHRQDAGRMAMVRYREGGDLYFGVRADFVTSSMRGRFDGTTIIMMGCSGLTSINETARAFLLKGAESFISWDNLVSWSHSDAATERLLELLLIEGLTTEDAVSQTEAELGPDPVFGAELRILEAGG